MTDKPLPKTTEELIAALADGEVELCKCPDLLARLSDDPCCGRKIVHQQRLREKVNAALCESAPCCPDELRAQIEAMCCGPEASDAPSSSAPVTPAQATPARPASKPQGPAVLARITRWIPAAMAAMLLIAAGVVFNRASQVGASGMPPSVLSVSRINAFASRHNDCANDPTRLYERERFGDSVSIQALPGKISDYLQYSPDGMNLDLSKVGYDYQMTGACSLPGAGAVHLIYRHRNDPNRVISLWLRPDQGDLPIDTGRLYVEAGENLDHPVILWKANGMMYYLIGDSLDDAHQAVDQLRQAA